LLLRTRLLRDRTAPRIRPADLVAVPRGSGNYAKILATTSCCGQSTGPAARSGTGSRRGAVGLPFSTYRATLQGVARVVSWWERGPRLLRSAQVTPVAPSDLDSSNTAPSA
jgi:hypothetical protein